VVVEHRIARLVQLGIRKSRFSGRAKTRFQLLMAATVANLALVANWMSSGGSPRLCGAGRPLSPIRRGSGDSLAH
jgi:hypothetical protein